jgi:hypothetical protein
MCKEGREAKSVGWINHRPGVAWDAGPGRRRAGPVTTHDLSGSGWQQAAAARPYIFGRLRTLWCDGAVPRPVACARVGWFTRAEAGDRSATPAARCGSGDHTHHHARFTYDTNVYYVRPVCAPVWACRWPLETAGPEISKFLVHAETDDHAAVSKQESSSPRKS